jgi:hypothetical protein
MDFFRDLQQDKIDLLDHLNSSFPSVALSLENLLVIPYAIDDILSQFLKSCIARHSPHLVGASAQDLGFDNFKVDGVTIDLTTTHNLKNEKNLIVAMLVHDVTIRSRQKKFRDVTVRLRETGTYSSVTFQIPAVLTRVDDDDLKQLAAEIFLVGYGWMNQQIVKGIRHACETTNRELYDYVRLMVPNKEVLEGFLFSAASIESDFVVLDDLATSSALVLASKSAGRLGRSAADIALQMMLEVIPLADSVIIEAVKHESSIDLDLSHDSYYQSDNSFSQCLQAVWGQTVSCFPVVSEGEFFLVAFFMPKYKNILEPLLVAHKERLQHIAREHGKAISNNLKIVDGLRKKSKELNAGRWAGVIGEFVGGVLKAHHGG